jgi:hypothetical protein
MPSASSAMPPELFFAAALLFCALLLYVLHLLGLFSILFGCTSASTVALLVRLAVAFSAASLSHTVGECGESSILVGSDTGAATALALAAAALGAAVWSGSFVGGHLRTATRFPLLAKLAFCATLAVSVGLGELGTTPPSELLANYWNTQRLSLRQVAALLMDPTRALADAPRAWLGLIFPSPLLTSAWILLHQRCFTAFVVAVHAAHALLALTFLAALLWGPRLCCAARKTRTE